jgi:TrmH family RNA methyltransferase
VAVVLGSEHAGLPAAWLDAADQGVRIPMRARVADSLNVGVAGAVLLFEAMRQRRA